MNFNEIKSQITIEDFSFELEGLKINSIYEAIEYIIDSFKLAENGNSYVQFLLDFANEYANKYGKTYEQIPTLLDGGVVAACTQLRACITNVSSNVCILIIFYKLGHDVR